MNLEKRKLLRKSLAIPFVLVCFALPILVRKYYLPDAMEVQELDFKVMEIGREAGLSEAHTMQSTRETPFSKLSSYLEATGASVAVSDVNEDGWYDIFLPSTSLDGQNRLYINDRRGHFTDEADKYGVKNFNIGISRATFFDCDNDGKKELFLNTLGCPILLKNTTGGRYTQIPFASGDDGCFWSGGVNYVDFNRDGLLDVVLAGFLPEWRNFLSWEKFFPRGAVSADNGGPLEAYVNQGGCKFQKSADIFHYDKRHFTLAIGAGDLRNTNNSDLWFATDFNTDKVYLYDRATGSYNQAHDRIGRTISTSGMNADIAYLDNDPYPYVFVTHVYRKGYFVGGNTLWRFDPKKEKFLDHGSEMGVRRCGWGWGGKFVDFNNDSYLDLASVNGMISANKEKDYMFKMSTIMSSSTGMLSDYGRWPALKDSSLSGYERDCLFLSNGKRFQDISEKINFDPDRLDGRGVAVIDFWNNGSQGLVVANQKQRPYLYSVVQENENRWIGFKLRGTKSNRDGVGAKIRLHLRDGRVLTRENRPYNGYGSQSDDRVHFGLGRAEPIESVQVQWPSGIQQELSKFELNAYNAVTEKADAVAVN